MLAPQEIDAEAHKQCCPQRDVGSFRRDGFIQGATWATEILTSPESIRIAAKAAADAVGHGMGEKYEHIFAIGFAALTHDYTKCKIGYPHMRPGNTVSGAEPCPHHA